MPVTLNAERRGLSLGKGRGIWLEGLLDLSGGELLDLLGGTADEGAGVEEGVEFAQDGVEECGAADALEQVVVLSVLLDIVCRLVGEDTCDGIC